MTKQKSGRVYECVVVDLNTQRDFCAFDGAYPVANHEELVPALRRVVAWTKRNQAPIVSSIEAHRPAELGNNGHPVCCFDGTPGQSKLEFTLFPLRLLVEVDNTFALPLDLFKHWQQVMFRKRTDDMFTNPKADRLFTHLPVREYVLFGTGLECSIKALALGLLAREKRVSVVTDACGYWHKPTADLALRQISAKGANVLTVEELLSRRLKRRTRYRRNGTVTPGVSSNGRLSIAARPRRTPGTPSRSAKPRQTESHEYHI